MVQLLALVDLGLEERDEGDNINRTHIIHNTNAIAICVRVRCLESDSDNDSSKHNKKSKREWRRRAEGYIQKTLQRRLNPTTFGISPVFLAGSRTYAPCDTIDFFL